MTLTHAERQIGPLVYPPPARADLDALTEDTHRRDAETKTADALRAARLEAWEARRESAYRTLPPPRAGGARPQFPLTRRRL